MTKIIFILFFLICSGYASDERISFRQQCLDNLEYLIKDQYRLDCNYSYHHYNAHSSRLYYDSEMPGELRIGSFNMFNPGNSQTYFKDNKLMAQLINEFDIVGATELLPVLGSNLDNNEAIKQFIDDVPTLLKDIEGKIVTTNNPVVATALKTEGERIKKDALTAPTLFRSPGYLKILTELRKLDPSWALLLTPRGQGAKTSNVQELAGFYYRAKKARTILNDYCKDFVTNNIGSPVSCIPNFGVPFMGKSLKDVFSRRPFIASFRSGNRDLTLLVSHVIFTSPPSSESMEKILSPTFGVTNYKDLGNGVTKQNYARFAEVRATLDFMNQLRHHYHLENVILMGDLNIEAQNPFWSELLDHGQQLFVTDATSVTQRRYNNLGVATNGYASNYDHFIYNPELTSGCGNARRYDFYKGKIASAVYEKYLIRTEKMVGDSYQVSSYLKMKQAVAKLDQQLKSIKTIKYNRVIWDNYKYQYRLDSLERRIFSDQLKDKTYYRLFTEILSDHTPVALNCQVK